MISIDSIAVYKLLRMLTMPIVERNAYNIGLIDSNGEMRRLPKTAREADAYGYFERLSIGLKRLIDEQPKANARSATYAAVMILMKEQDAHLLEFDTLHAKFDAELRQLSHINFPDFNDLKEAAKTIKKLRTSKDPRLVYRSQMRKTLKKFLKDREDWASGRHYLIKNPVKEEAPSNAVGGGAVHGLGVGPKGEPGIAPLAMLRRKLKKTAQRI